MTTKELLKVRDEGSSLVIFYVREREGGAEAAR